MRISSLDWLPPAPGALDARQEPWADAPFSHILFDLTRMIARAHHSVPRGIDRVSLEYALFLEGLKGKTVSYCFYHDGQWRLFSPQAARWLLSALSQRWIGLTPHGLRSHGLTCWTLRHGRMRKLLRSGICSRPLERLSRPTLYFNVSHKAWLAVRDLRRVAGDRLTVVALLHDLMPLNTPSFFPEQLQAEFREGLEILAQEAALLLANTPSTLSELEAWAEASGIELPPRQHVRFGIRSLPLGGQRRHPGQAPHFVFLGGMDPRKNFSHLRDVWARLEAMGEPPRLYAVGVDDEAARLPGIVPLRDATDLQIAELMRSSRALLFPSLAEGFGLPLWEAFALGTPVICSPLPVFREQGAGLAEFVPLDSTEQWVRVIGEYARPGCEARKRQLARLAGQTVPDWPTHFDQVGAAIVRSVEDRDARSSAELMVARAPSDLPTGVM